jgi:dUTP pyrophosphatase
MNKLSSDVSSEVYQHNEKSSDLFSLNVKLKKLSVNAVVPEYSKDGDAGLDLTVSSVIEENEHLILYGFGLSLEIPHGYVGLVFPRSSIKNYGLILSNCVGVIDSNYRGEIMAYFRKTKDKSSIYGVGERACQMIILPYPRINLIISDELSDTNRGSGGFGSSGK